MAEDELSKHAVQIAGQAESGYPKIPETTDDGILKVKDIYRGLAYLGVVTAVTDTQHFTVAGLAGFGNGFFYNWEVYVVWDAGGAHAAPQTEYQTCDGYTSSTGAFSIDTAYTQPIAVGDKVLITHTWNLQVAAALIDVNLDHFLKTAIADTTDPVDMAEVVDDTILANILTDDGDTSRYDRRTESLMAIREMVEAAIAGKPGLLSAFNTTQTTKNSSVTLFGLDALGGAMRNIVVEFYLALDAAATFTPTVHKTRPGDLVTLTQEAIPAISTIATPAANRKYRYECGDLAEGLQFEFRLAQDNNGAANVTCDATISYER